MFTFGPMFRHEQPQAGRYRQFHQIDAEVFGNPGPRVDVEIIVMLERFLAQAGVADVKLIVNSLGCPHSDCRPAFREKLKQFLEERLDKLCPDCVRRTELNPLRVLDCKVPSCREAVQGAPSTLDHLCVDCLDHFRGLEEGLKTFGIDYTVEKRLVRGLDYYTRTIFEVISSSLGGQDAVAGGGRYDLLAELLGGPSIPAIGFAVGLERLVTVSNLDVSPVRPDLYIAALGEKAIDFAFELANRLRLSGVTVELSHSQKSLKSQMRRADKLQAARVLIIGDAEMESGMGALRDMASKEQSEVPLNAPVDELKTLVLANGNQD